MTRSAPTVVVVDDAADLRALVRTHIRLSGQFEVVAEGETGLDAIELAARHEPDLLLLDISMPQMDGLEALPRVREVSPRTRVVMFTGFDEQGLTDRALELGAAALLEKSVSVHTLADDLQAILSRPNGARRELATAAATGPGSAGSSPMASGPSASGPSYSGPTVRRPDDPQGRQPEQILDDHVERFREVFEEAAIGMGTMTLTGRLVRVNKAMATLVGRRVSDMVGLGYESLLTDDSLRDFRRALTRVTEGGADVARLEHQIRGEDEQRTMLTTLAPVRDANRRALYLFVQGQDITGQREAEAALRQSEDRFRLLIDAVRDYAIFMLDPQGHVVSWNGGAQRLKGYSADEIIGRHFRTFYPQSKRDARHPENELEWALRDGRYQEEGWRIRKDGSRFWAHVTISAVHDETGQHLGFAKVTRDMTAQRFAEDALRQSEERFRLLVEAVGDYAIFMLDPQGNVISWNAGAERLKGYTADEIIGQHFRAFYPPAKQASRYPEHELEIALRDGRYEEEGWRIRKDGSRFWANIVLTAVHSDSGEHIGFAKITRDITERRRMLDEQLQSAESLASANRELAVANEQLARAADNQAQFLAVTAHELRAPIGVLGGSTDLLRRHWGDLDESERAELFDSMSANASRLRRLLDDLLTAARLEVGAVQFSEEDVEVGSVVRNAVAAARRSHPDSDIVVDVADNSFIRGDAGRIGQAVDNLLANALSHGRPPVTVAVRRSGPIVEVRVSDEGPGVPAEIEPRLFARFATGARRGGTGLGLFIVRELARAHGGEARYEPAQDGAGPTFVLRFPALEISSR